MKLSVVMPVLDEAAGIAATLRSLAPLRARGHEVVVVDGGSADATVVLASAAADRVIQGPRGRARQMNAGAAVAQGDVLLFLHADTVLPDAAGTSIRVADHCYGCTAGQGSSCGGALEAIVDAVTQPA